MSVADPLVLDVVDPAPPDARVRPVAEVVTARRQLEGAGFAVRRPFPGPLDPRLTDPFLMLDHLGPVVWEPEEAVGAPDHPHRGFETVTYLLDGEVQHRDSHGGGGVIGAGDTQWMTAGSGLVHSEMPTEAVLRSGGRSHGFQLWVNLPAAEKLSPPRYQDLTGERLTLLRSADGGAVVRLIAGRLGRHAGPGSTRTPIVLAHATLSPGAQLDVPWPSSFGAMAYVISGAGRAGSEGRPLVEGQLALLGPGDSVRVAADATQPADAAALDVLLLGGQPIREPIAQYGPFVMNHRHEILQAIEDFQAGRMGVIPPAA